MNLNKSQSRFSSNRKSTIDYGFKVTKQGNIFKLLLTTFEVSGIFGGSWNSRKNRLEPKNKSIEAILTKLSLSKSVKHSVVHSVRK